MQMNDECRMSIDNGGTALLSRFKIDRSTQKLTTGCIHYSMFDLPEADKCLLAFGELDVRCSLVSFFDLTGRFFGSAAGLTPCMKLHRLLQKCSFFLD